MGVPGAASANERSRLYGWLVTYSLPAPRRARAGRAGSGDRGRGVDGRPGARLPPAAQPSAGSKLQRAVEQQRRPRTPTRDAAGQPRAAAAPSVPATNLAMAAVRRSGRSAWNSSRRENCGMRFQSPGGAGGRGGQEGQGWAGGLAGVVEEARAAGTTHTQPPSTQLPGSDARAPGSGSSSGRSSSSHSRQRLALAARSSGRA